MSLPKKVAALELQRHGLEQQFRLMVESIQDYAIFMIDPEGHVATWNEGARKIKGYEPDEIIGHSISRFYEDAARLAGRPAMLLERARTEGRAEDEGWRVRRDGSRFWANVVITALRDPQGTLIGFAKLTRDLTERRAVEEELRMSEARFRLLVESVQDYAIFMLSPEGIITTWNAGAERIKGYTAKEVIGTSFERFYPKEDLAAGKTKRELERAARDGRFEDEGWRVRKDGTRFWANVVLTAVRDASGTLLGFAKVTRDLTSRKKTEEDRVRIAQGLEAVRLRDEFLSIAAHELKTPITALQLQLQSLQQPLRQVDEKLARKVERAAFSTSRLDDLIEALLDVSRIATGRFELNPTRFDLSDALQQTVDRLREAADRAGSTLIFSSDGETVGTWDRLRLEQLVTNLLSNAFKYGAQAPVSVALSREEGQAVIRVTDQGPGIPTEAMHRIFERFERAVSAQHYGGMGLGLYVSKQVVDAHGGTISAENLPGRGACFTVRLPIR